MAEVTSTPGLRSVVEALGCGKYLFSGLSQNRRTSRDYERLCATGEAFIYVAMSRSMVRRLELAHEAFRTVSEAGEVALLHCDGLVEAHDPQREMFGFPRLQGLVGTHRDGGSSLVAFLLSELTRFAGEDWEQEDDITLVTLERSEEL